MAANSKVNIKKQSNEISFKDSIKTKLIAILLAVAAIPIIIAVIVSYKTSTGKAKADALRPKQHVSLLDLNAGKAKHLKIILKTDKNA